ncbi:DUF2637 domain-containing protein [Streptomyces sp. RTGN2]|uniref:DUF2637 domain-containing protein n=1 Tax=Streptomyces sp. RTGN2 TaxID=3016525 RepID=UPI00255348C0|nr:DUF2637 domain-containing protein [Streptomyces sp. RTGN2]
MSTMSAPTTAHITGWDRMAVIALGSAGCALSYDALQQMAVAIHIRGFLTYLFPLVIDGFIAYGIRALLVLRDAPLRARLYVWTLFGTATAASIWANALHAVRLNEEAVAGTGLRLGDTVVAVLSTIAPLALAGAVHLYILIARGPVKARHREHLGQAGDPGRTGRGDRIAVTGTDRAGQQQPQAGQVGVGQPVTHPTHRPREVTDLPGQSDTGPSVTPRPAGNEPVAGHQDSLASAAGQLVTPPPVIGQGSRTTSDRRPDPDTEELLKIARSAVRAEDKLTRKVVAQAIRGQQIPLSSDTLTALMAQLRKQHGQPVTTARN